MTAISEEFVTYVGWGLHDRVVGNGPTRLSSPTNPNFTRRAKDKEMGFDLGRFVKAQYEVYDNALQELRDGKKKSHWMWFIFPQIHGLGRSHTARFYAISGRVEAEAYLQHRVLGPRLEECTRAMLSHPSLSAHDILGSPDDLKFHSSMTLFAAVAQGGSSFEAALQLFYGGRGDQATLATL